MLQSQYVRLKEKFASLLFFVKFASLLFFVKFFSNGSFVGLIAIKQLKQLFSCI